MSIDLEKLSPAPWVVDLIPHHDGDELLDKAIRSPNDRVCTLAGNAPKDTGEGENELADAAFNALARNAFDVMTRRGWHPEFYVAGKWCVVMGDGGVMYRFRANGGDGSRVTASDPFTALREADQWVKENVEEK